MPRFAFPRFDHSQENVTCTPTCKGQRIAGHLWPRMDPASQAAGTVNHRMDLSVANCTTALLAAHPNRSPRYAACNGRRQGPASAGRRGHGCQGHRRQSNFARSSKPPATTSRRSSTSDQRTWTRSTTALASCVLSVTVGGAASLDGAAGASVCSPRMLPLRRSATRPLWPKSSEGMPLQLVTPASEEPVSLAEAKLHLRVESDDDDALIGALITAARQAAETLRPAVSSTTARWKLVLDSLPGPSPDGRTCRTASFSAARTR
jgi:hypothetical protein